MAPRGSPHLRVLLTRLQLPLTALVVTHVVGTVGFHWLWAERGGSWFDALYMTFITITTIGFAEIFPLSTAGRLLTMAIAASGIGSLFYSFTVILDYAANDDVRASRRIRKMQKAIDGLSGHFIVAGLGRVGRESAAELVELKRSFVVVDPGEASEAWCRQHGVLFLRGDAAEDEVLQRAGITRAKGLIVTTSSDATNLYVILSARLLNPEIFIAARAIDHTSAPKLMRAGANRAVSPHAIGGRRLAHLMISPRVVDFFETALRRGNQSLNIDDIVVAPASKMVGRSVGELAPSGATVLAVLRDGTPTVDLGGAFVLSEGDHVLVLGTDSQLSSLE